MGHTYTISKPTLNSPKWEQSKYLCYGKLDADGSQIDKWGYKS